MASENPDDRKEFDPLRYGSKKPDKLYIGVYARKGGTWYAQCSHEGEKGYIGTYSTVLEAALAYDKRGRELKRPEKSLNFPRFLTEPAFAIANANARRGDKRKQITISREEYDAYLPYHKARKRAFAQRRQNVLVSGVAMGSLSANISSVQPAAMEWTGNPGEVKEVPDEELLRDGDKEFHGPKADLNFPDSPTDDNSSPAPIRPESANIPMEQEELVNKYTEYVVKHLFDEEEEDDHDPSEQEKVNQYVEDITNLISDNKGSESRKREFAPLPQNVSVIGVAIGSPPATISSVQPAAMEWTGNPGVFKDVPDEELLSTRELVERLLNQGPPSDEDKPSDLAEQAGASS